MCARGPRFPSFTLIDVGNGRLFEHNGPLMLERREGKEWIEVAQYGTPHEAAEALDEQLANGTVADHLRLTAIPHSRLNWRTKGHLSE